MKPIFQASRSLALLIEIIAQQLLRRTSAAWLTGRAARLKLDKAYFRGRDCYCPPSLPMHLVHSEGIREGCDVVVDFGSNVQQRVRKQIPLQFLRPIAPQIGAGDTVYVKSDNLPEFVELLLPSITGPIVLVTGDSDRSCVQRFEELLHHPKIHHWFAQNCDVSYAHSRLTRLPIGLDNPIFTKPEKRLGFLLTMLLGKTPLDPGVNKNDMGNQALLQQIKRQSLRPTRERPAKALCTFHQNQKLVTPDLGSTPARERAYQYLKDNPACYFIPHRLLQADCWRIHDQYAFEICPHGNGLDCFRTWECLFLETIPIVETSPLDRLYQDEGLPVVIVESYREITPERLRQWQAEKQDSFTLAMLYKLTTDYWLDKIRRTAQPLLANPVAHQVSG